MPSKKNELAKWVEHFAALDAFAKHKAAGEASAEDLKAARAAAVAVQRFLMPTTTIFTKPKKIRGFSRIRVTIQDLDDKNFRVDRLTTYRRPDKRMELVGEIQRVVRYSNEILESMVVNVSVGTVEENNAGKPIEERDFVLKGKNLSQISTKQGIGGRVKDSRLKKNKEKELAQMWRDYLKKGHNYQSPTAYFKSIGYSRSTAYRARKAFEASF